MNKDKIKTAHSAAGARKMCPNFKPCPLCYGCRNYSSKYIECDDCAKDIKYNVCNTNKHNAKVLGIMIANNEQIII